MFESDPKKFECYHPGSFSNPAHGETQYLHVRKTYTKNIKGNCRHIVKSNDIFGDTFLACIFFNCCYVANTCPHFMERLWLLSFHVLQAQ
jgi:hypothetical protein